MNTPTVQTQPPRRGSWERLFFAGCLAAALLAVLGFLSDRHPTPTVGPQGDYPLPNDELSAEQRGFRTVSSSSNLPQTDRALFRKPTDAIALAPIELVTPVVELTVPLRYESVVAYQIDSPRYRPVTANDIPYLSRERAKERFLWKATVRFQNEEPEEVRVIDYNPKGMTLILSRDGALPVTYRLRNGPVTLIDIGSSPLDEYSHRSAAAKTGGTDEGYLNLARWCLINTRYNHLFQPGLNDLAENALHQAIQIEPQAIMPYLLLAEMAHADHDAEGELQAYLLAQRHKAKHPRLQLRYGLLLCRLTLWESAREQFVAAATAPALAGQALGYLGETYLKTGDFKRAKGFFLKAAEHPGGVTAARNGLGLTALLQHHETEPMITGTDPLSIAVTAGLPEARINLIASLLMEGRADEAAARATDWLSEPIHKIVDPPAPDARLVTNGVLALAADHRLGEARQQLEAMIDQQPLMNEPTVQFCYAPLVRSYLDILDGSSPRLARAVEHLRTALQGTGTGPIDRSILPTVKYLRAYINYRWARLANTPQEQHRLYALAEEGFRNALRYSYRPVDCLIAAARCAEPLDLKRTESYLRRARQLDPNRAEVTYKLLELSLQQRPANALTAALAREVIAETPRDPYATASLAIVDFREGDVTRSLERLNRLVDDPSNETPDYLVRLSERVTHYRSYQRRRFTFTQPDGPSVGWEWSEIEAPGEQVVVAVQDNAVQIGVGAQSPDVAPSFSKPLFGNSIISVGAQFDTAEAAVAEVALSLMIIDPAEHTVREQVSLFKTGRTDQNDEQLAYRVMLADGTIQSGTLAPWPAGQGTTRLKIEITSQKKFLFYMNGTALKEPAASFRLVDHNPLLKEVAVTISGHAPLGRAWRARVDNLDIVKRKEPGDG